MNPLLTSNPTHAETLKNKLASQACGKNINRAIEKATAAIKKGGGAPSLGKFIENINKMSGGKKHRKKCKTKKHRKSVKQKKHRRKRYRVDTRKKRYKHPRYIRGITRGRKH